MSDFSSTGLEGVAQTSHGDYIQNQPAPVYYGIILAPFYSSNNNVKSVIDRTLKLKEPEIVMPVLVELLKWKAKVPDTIIASLSKNINTRTIFFSLLEKEGLENQFDPKYASQQQLNVALLSNRFLPKSTTESEKSVIDSLVLVKKLKAKNRYQSGELHVYRHTKYKNNEMPWHAVFIDERNKNLTAKIETPFPTFYPDPQKSENDNLNQLLNQFSLLHRNRAGGNAWSKLNLD